jgi:hypothetical protein
MNFWKKFVYESWNDLFMNRETICLWIVKRFVYESWNDLFMNRETICKIYIVPV